ncbi:MAG TPA: aspartyl/asparaginyl beta-hydroxylase domain-containing protein [Caulobacteraceae bacterium]|nr:aspartyl/asparaginyl beta-hydroxylase domain-containing protein [Caulobacteraceae bacterium]
MSTVPAAQPNRFARAVRALSQTGRRIEAAVERWLAKNSLAETSEIISRTAVPWAATLEANWTTIRRELDEVLRERAALPTMQELSPYQERIVQGRVWKAFVFRAYGMRFSDNCRRCPETAKLLDAVPGLEVAFFSVLEPGAHLAAHRGAYKGLIRTHLGLVVPEPRDRVRMKVGGETIVWQEGRAVTFDDTYRHEVWNDTDGVRVVLLIDTPRPLAPGAARVNWLIVRGARIAPMAFEFYRRLRKRPSEIKA